MLGVWFVWLSLCLLATLCKSCRVNLSENFTTDVLVNTEELVEFWNSSASESESRNFKISSAAEMRHFPTVWLTSLEKLMGT